MASIARVHYHHSGHSRAACGRPSPDGIPSMPGVSRPHCRLQQDPLAEPLQIPPTGWGVQGSMTRVCGAKGGSGAASVASSAPELRFVSRAPTAHERVRVITDG
ncbi:unnamed protein product [Pieris brassicae]|uniref:Uncharacterized protein n=1 Tax=Pieris brassicae TaxID=7116 RepID=A0A9P0WYK7_PIEBR|nr:unnamed protein product [Pieris brassicae]